jgi:curved DNA-binding protein CbpA
VVQTHYEVLGVARSATTDQVRAAYRAAARDHHPDAGGDADRMRAVNAAWRVLGDPMRRAAYDRALSRGSAAAATATGAAATPGRPPEPDWVPDIGDLDLTAEEWADLADSRPIGQTMALAGWWAIFPPGAFVASVLLLFTAGYFTSPALLALSGGMFILSLGLFILAPLRAMAKRKGG